MKSAVSLALFAIIVGLVSLASVAWSDSQVNPKDGGGWGDPNEANKMLQMTKTPDVVRDGPLSAEERDRLVPAKAKGDCTDSSGRPLDAASAAGKGCSLDTVNAVAQPTPPPVAGHPSSSQKQGYTFSP